MNDDIFAEEIEVALHQLVTVYEETTLRFTYVASLIEDSVLAGKFIEISSKKKKQTETIIDHIRSMGFLIKDLDEEKELLEELFIRLKSIITDDKRRLLIQELLNEDKITKDALNTALSHELPISFRSYLESCQQKLGLELEQLLTELDL